MTSVPSAKSRNAECVCDSSQLSGTSVFVFDSELRSVTPGQAARGCTERWAIGVQTSDCPPVLIFTKGQSPCPRGALMMCETGSVPHPRGECALIQLSLCAWCRYDSSSFPTRRKAPELKPHPCSEQARGGTRDTRALQLTKQLGPVTQRGAFIVSLRGGQWPPAPRVGQVGAVGQSAVRVPSAWRGGCAAVTQGPTVTSDATCA